MEPERAVLLTVAKKVINPDVFFPLAEGPRVITFFATVSKKICIFFPEKRWCAWSAGKSIKMLSIC